jgi:hypothetical protein
VIGWTDAKEEPFPEDELPELHSQYQNEDQQQQFGTGLGLGGESGENIAFPGYLWEIYIYYVNLLNLREIKFCNKLVYFLLFFKLFY